jgi:hypothetical protein
MTCEALELGLGMKHQTCSAQVWVLERSGRIEPVGRTTNKSGAPARLYGVRK